MRKAQELPYDEEKRSRRLTSLGLWYVFLSFHCLISNTIFQVLKLLTTTATARHGERRQNNYDHDHNSTRYRYRIDERWTRTAFEHDAKHKDHEGDNHDTERQGWREG